MAMPILEFEDQPGYLHIRITGDNTPENVVYYFSQVLKACTARGTANVLIEENLRGPGLSLGRIFEVASQASEHVRPIIERVAYVDTNPDHEFDKMQFAETVAANRGVLVRVFQYVYEAQAWLRISEEV